jgi:hypothetical protein
MTEDTTTPSVEYTEKELEARSGIINDCRNAADQRQYNYIEFDDMSFEVWYEKSKKAAAAYIKPKDNEEDVRVVMGTTREKGNILVNTLLNYNLEADITAYDEDDIKVQELGELTEKMVRKSRQLENPVWEVKRPLAYLELVNQGNVHIEECWEGYSIPQKQLESFDWNEGIDPSKIKWKELLNKVYYECNAKVLPGLHVYPGNVRQFFIEQQPFMVLRDVLSRAEAESKYKGWTRMKYVPKTFTTHAVSEMDQENTYDDYQMIQTEVDQIEELRYYNKWTNTFQVLLNGVCMLPVGFPMSSIIGVCEYPIVKADCEPISTNFYWSRGIGSKNRVPQFLLDEMFKLMVLKTRKSFAPSVGNMTGQDIGQSIYYPSRIFKDLDPDKIKPIGDATGVTPAEFNMMQFVKSVSDENTTDSSFQGQAPDNKATARQVVEQQQRSMVKIGMAMLGVINMENRMAWLRLYNILENWTQKHDGRYRRLSVKDTLENGKEGERIIEFTEDVQTDEQTFAEEELYSQTSGRNVRINRLNPKVIRKAKYRWEIQAVPTEKNSSLVKAATFTDYLRETMAIFAPFGKLPNMDYLADRHAIVNDEDPEKIWEQQNPQQQQQAQQVTQGQEQPNPEITSQLLPRGENKPSINAMAGA